MTLLLPAHLSHLVPSHDGGNLVEDANAVFCPMGCHRYALTRVSNPSRSVVVYIMLNPSTANAYRLDPTVTRCYRRATRWGAGGIVVLNAFALRSTDPGKLRWHADPVGRDTDDVIRWLLGPDGPYTVGRVIVGWGCDQTLRRSRRDRTVIDLVRELGHRPMCLGVTAAGFPRHPLYARYDAEPFEPTSIDGRLAVP